jgi:sterol desaturase/sphingolipid hydroxylase (fatty acid hydroxylase superfamily)
LYAPECLDTLERWGGIAQKPDPENRRKREGIRIFRNPILEQGLSKAHPIMPIVWTGPFIVLGIYRAFAAEGASLPLGGMLFVLGLLMWTLLEYGLHRFLFHWEGKGPSGKVLSFMLHGYHHEFPDDKMRLVAPALMLFVLGGVIGLGYHLVFGPRYWAQIFAGTAAGYVLYDWTHYYAHHFHPRRGPGSWIRRYHLRHHFQEGHDRFGISSPLWDLVFRTYRSPDR